MNELVSDGRFLRSVTSVSRPVQEIVHAGWQARTGRILQGRFQLSTQSAPLSPRAVYHGWVTIEGRPAIPVRGSPNGTWQIWLIFIISRTRSGLALRDEEDSLRITHLSLLAICAGALSGTSRSGCVDREGRHSPFTDDPQQAAQVALLVLRATTKGAMSTSNYAILPSAEPRTLDAASGLLATMTKPVACSGEARSETLVVTCQILDEREVAEHARGAALSIAGLARDARQGCSDPFDEAKAVLTWQGGQRTVLIRSVSEWLRDYNMFFSLGTESVEPPKGICLILLVRPPATMKIKNEANTHRS